MAARLIEEGGWRGVTPEQAGFMPSTRAGTAAEIVEQLKAWREPYGFVRLIFANRELDACVPVIHALAGQ